MYLWQFVFIIFGVLSFLFSKNDFTFFNILLFLVPIIFDLLYNEMKSTPLNILKKIFVVINCLCVIICVVGITMLKENNLTVYGEVLYIIGEIDLSVIKKFMFYVLISNVIVPVMFYFGRPCLKNLNAVETFLNMKPSEKFNDKEKSKCS